LVIEREDGILTFLNAGVFIPGSIEKVINDDAPEISYRNPFLTNAMVNLNMIDTIGSGIKKMFLIQRNKFFPLPEFSFDNHQVKLKIIGKVQDLNYAKKLASISNLSLNEIILIDRIAKGKLLSRDEAKLLQERGIVAGKYPKLYLSASTTPVTDKTRKLKKHHSQDDLNFQILIIEYLKNFKQGKKEDFEKLLLDKLPDTLDIYQKKNKIKNILQSLRKKGIIVPIGKVWTMSNG
jgi:ATP-dependent DNA helicase RecG